MSDSGPSSSKAAPPSARRRPCIDVVAVLLVLLAVALRLVYQVEQRANPFFDYPLLDSLYHVEWARALAAGEDFQPGPFFRAPLYPWVLGTWMRLVGEDYVLLRGLGALLGGATTCLTYLVGRRAFGRPEGLLAAALVATNWVLIYFDGELLIPTLAIPLNLFALFLTLGLSAQGAPRAFGAAGMAWGLAAAARPNVLLFMPVLALWWLHRSAGRRRAALLQVAALAAGTLVPILPLTAYNSIVGGDSVLISSQAGVNLWIGNNPASDGSTAIVPGTRPGWWDGFHDAIALAEAAEGRELAPSEVSRHYTARAVRFWLEEPGAALRLLGWKARLFLSRYELGNNQDVGFFATRYSHLARWLPPSWPLLLPLGLVGLVLAARRHSGTFALWAFAPVYSASVLLFFVCSRYRAPILPILAVLGAHAVLAAWELARQYRWRALAPGLIGSALALALTLPVPAAVDTTDAKGLWQLGTFELEAGRANEALPYLYQAVEANPRFWVARRDQGLALLRTGQAREAARAWEAALALSPGDVQVSALYVPLATALGETEDALSVARASLERHPDLALAHATLGGALAGAGRLAEAREALGRGLSLDREDYACNLTLGRLEVAAGRPCDAVEPLARAAAAAADPAGEAAQLWRVAVGDCP